MSHEGGIELASKGAQVLNIEHGVAGKIGQLFRIDEQSLFAWMKLSVDRKEDVKVTRQPRRYPVIKTDRILAGDRRLDLMEIAGLHTAAKDRPILSENRLEEAMRISSSSLTLQICQPTIGIRQINTLAQAETDHR